MSHVLLLAVLLAGQVRPEQPTEPPLPMAVQVGLFAYGPDGAIIGSATTGAEAGSFEGSVFTMPTCGFASSNQVPDQAMYAWVVKGEVLERRGVGVVVQIDWTRARQDGRLTTLAGSQHVVIRKDVPLVLDEMIASQPERCEIARVSLEVRLTPRSTTRGGGRGTGRGGVAHANASGGGTASVDNATTAFDVELWLVHGNRRMKERTVPMQVRVPSSGGAFVFPAIRLTMPGGEVSATVGGRIAFGQAAGPQGSALLVSISRTLRLVLAQPPPIREVANTGSTEITHRMPGPDDVVAFMMPPIRFPDVGLELPDTLSVRLRVRPAR